MDYYPEGGYPRQHPSGDSNLVGYFWWGVIILGFLIVCCCAGRVL